MDNDKHSGVHVLQIHAAECGVSCYSIDFDVDDAAGLAEHSLLG